MHTFKMPQMVLMCRQTVSQNSPTGKGLDGRLEACPPAVWYQEPQELQSQESQGAGLWSANLYMHMNVLLNEDVWVPEPEVYYD